MESTEPPGTARHVTHELQNSKRRRLDALGDEPPRSRNTTACHKCRARKTKCDNRRPSCGYCLSHRLECAYEDRPAEALVEYDQGTKAILERLDGQQTVLNQLRLAVDGLGSNAATGSSFGGTTGSRDPVFNGTGELPSLAASFSDGPIDPSSGCGAKGFIFESILAWPALGRIVPPQWRDIRSFALQSIPSEDVISTASSSRITGPSSVVGEESIFPLCQRFFEVVHVRNPLLQKDDILRSARQISENGLSWDSRSCLLLVLCALACIATPYDMWPEHKTPTPGRASSSSGDDYEMAEAYFHMAKKRMGMLETGLVDIQCFFFAGMYEKHALRPMGAWYNTEQACTRLLVYFAARGGPFLEHAFSGNPDQRRLEERLLWSCVKAEGELLEHLPLRPSGIRQIQMPPALPSYGPGPLTPLEEQSWFYYLSDLALRRIMDREFSLLYPENSPEIWASNIDHFTSLCTQSSDQVLTWYRNLPDQLQSQFGIAPPDQLSLYMETRLLGNRALILRPVLWFVLHHQAGPNTTVLAQETVDLHVEMLEKLGRHGRHGGLWFICRSAWYAATVLLAVVSANASGQSPRTITVPGDWQELVKLALGILSAWKEEASDIRWMYNVLQQTFHTLCVEL